MDIRIIDAHTHAQFPEYDQDRDEVICRALDAGIGMINVGTDIEMSRKAVELTQTYKEGVWATIGIHPTEMLTNADWTRTFAELERLGADEKVVGIGECGIDYFRLSREAELREAQLRGQKELFIAQIDLAHRVQKPLVLHVRSSAGSTDAFDDVLEILNAHKNLLKEAPGICHFFTGTKDIAKKFLDLNFSFTFGGLITYNREFDEVLELIPADHMLVETDAPFVSPKSCRGHRNEPSFVEEVATFLSDFKKVSDEVFFENTKKVFNL